MFGEYEIIETVGEGGMGVVYRAKDTSLGRIVALKVLKDDLRAHKSLVARFQREAEAYATLNHPHIVHIYSVGAVGQIPYIAMEFIEGGTLSVTMKRERRIPWERALLIAEQVAEALGSAHSMGIIHRDIKPGNIMLSPEEHAYVTDFGIAKVLTAETQLTLEGSRLGTPQYMSPERCSKETGSASSDLYSLGVVLFQMISSRLPYESKDTGELIRKIMVDPPKRLSDFMPDIPEDVERLVAFLIEKKARDRPQSAEEWVRLSQRVRAGESIGSSDKTFQSGLEDLRETVTHSSSYSDTHFTLEENSVLWRLQSIWLNTPINIRAVFLGILVVMLAGIAGWRSAIFHAPEQATALAHSLGALQVDWKDIEPVASFYDEIPGMLAIHLSDKAWRPTALTSLHTGATLIEIEEQDEGIPTGAKGLLQLDTHQRSARILFPPSPLSDIHLVTPPSETAGVQLQLTNAQEHASSLYTYFPEDTTPKLNHTTLATLWGRLPHYKFQTLGYYALMPATSQLLCAGTLGDAPEEWGIYRLAPGKGVGVSLIQTGTPITTFALTESRIVYSQADEAGLYQLFAISPTRVEQRPLPLLKNLKEKGVFFLHPDREELLAIRKGSEGDEAVWVDIDAKEVTPFFVGAREVRWHPNGYDALTLAPDENGVFQVWQVSLKYPNSPLALTTLEDGIRTLGTLIPEKNQLLASGGTQRQPALLLIDLP